MPSYVSKGTQEHPSTEKHKQTHLAGVTASRGWLRRVLQQASPAALVSAQNLTLFSIEQLAACGVAKHSPPSLQAQNEVWPWSRLPFSLYQQAVIYQNPCSRSPCDCCRKLTCCTLKPRHCDQSPSPWLKRQSARGTLNSDLNHGFRKDLLLLQPG